MSSCLTCASSRVLSSGPRTGGVWCFVKRSTVIPANVCHSFTVAATEGRDHELVKSDPKAHFDPFLAVDQNHAGV